MEKKKLLVELTEDQYNTITALASMHKLSKADVIRTLCDMIDGMDAGLNMLVFDGRSIRFIEQFSKKQDVSANPETESFSFECSFNPSNGVSYKGNLSLSKRGGSFV
jgi:ABC-type uncharacterized transport system ATPase subunit